MSRIPTSGFVALAGALALSACSFGDSVRNEEGVIVEGGEVSVFEFQQGDCFAADDSDEVESLEAIPCGQEHETQVFATFDLTAATYPGEEAVNELADEGCLDRFDAYVGIDYQSSVFGFGTLIPTQETWDAVNDREVVCLLGRADGEPNVGTAEGSGI